MPANPLIRGAARRLRNHRTLGRWALRCVPDVRKRVDVPELGPFVVRLRRNRSFWLRNPVDLERFGFAAIAALLKPGQTGWDIGGNLGLYARFMADVVDAAKVVTFEPMAGNLPLLAENAALSRHASRITVEPVAVSDADGNADLQVDDMMSATAALDAVTHGEAAQGRALLGLQPKTETVPTRAIDTLIDEGRLPLPDFMKIDVEGAETLVLKGAARTLDEVAPSLFIETHGLPVARETLDLLWSHGYHVAGSGHPESLGAGYLRVDQTVADLAQHPHDLRYLLASVNEADLPETLPLWRGDQAD